MTTEKKIFNVWLWFMAGFTLLILLSSCSPLAMYEAPATATPSATATLTKPNNSPTPTPPSCTVTAYTLNLRTGPGMSYAVKWILERGEVVTILERGDWLKVSTGTATGFIYGRYCRQ